MQLRLAWGAIAGLWLLACAVGSRDDGPFFDDAGATSSEAGVDLDAAKADGASPSSFDAGPPAVVGGNSDGGEDAAPEPSGADGGCTTLAQCPYESATNVAGVACMGGVCLLTCVGENYDVNGEPSDGCEVAAACPVGNGKADCPIDDHSQDVATNLGSFDCIDGDSAQNLTGTIPSDDRAHMPAIDGFDAVTGSAPRFFQMFGTGGICEDNANFSLQMNAPTSQLACYVLTLITDEQTQTCTSDATGACSITNGSGSYEDNSTIYVEVSKAESCTAATFRDDGTFTVTGHL